MRVNTITIAVAASVCSAMPVTQYPLLQQPSALSSSGGRLDVDLTVSAGKVQGPFGISYNSRLYSNVYPAPTIRCRAGDTVRVKLNNELQDNNATRESEMSLNELHHPNSTNLHLHGMHISSEGHQDNVGLSIKPGFSFQYVYEINPKHHSGTSYYHPHLHGSTNLQVHGLMAGAFIVEDDPKKTSPDLLAMDDLVVMVQGIYMGNSEAFLNTCDHNGTSSMPVELENPEQVSENLLIVNGQYMPRVEFKIGELKRLRVVNGLSMEALMFGLSDDEACDIYELAYDGVYLEAPRAATKIFIPSGGRVDVAVRCSASGLFSLTTVADERLADYAQIWGPVPGQPGNIDNTQALLMIDVSDKASIMELPVVLPALPKYLQKVRSRSSNKHSKWKTTFSVELSTAEGANAINNQPFNPTETLNTIHLDKYYQWNLSAGEGFQEGEGYPQHPYHQHINHFMITNDDPITDGMLFRKGDFRDTIPLFASTPVDVRFYTADYAGPMMLHCHNLGHEDKGMMGVVGIEK
ncbi:hypothetical protein SARC_08922 [Sphaeroforma arctica JP610]|uniref:Plastocyanin-like domain-containing protein n=2 Tax=Sphaeroforma arctica JP610 TaxID=667725 RepID=A0A0L0FQ57_9EUKA|nr:hypothetical protein SARC_08922 [Sphaeroforma arctica JP610]KNC78656.1 hypothetical protein SARC_08922 [Sphaeroforma arctica JP610]|eukprot:XP_014152558.1 hypothetical protein SARC_08922 [Sphaeroforma arctica JP610]